MKNFTQSLAQLAVTAWVGSLWAIGYLAVPVLFHAQPDKQLAGRLAGEMFSAAGYLDIVCALYLLGFYLAQSGRAVISLRVFQLVLSMLLITLIIVFGIQPVMTELKAQALPLDVMHSALAGQFKMLHGVSSICYLIESVLGIFLVIQSTQSK
jgi:hypothetical protein